MESSTVIQPVESVEQEAGSSITEDGVGEKATALHNFQRPQEAGCLLPWMKWKRRLLHYIILRNNQGAIDL